ncbi:tripartite tricarboxylate transporter substrate binding protein [Roseicella aerolata]|uniref:Tripartite tricarboxylate transporter substrate binding protein n=1 Tax=Roseicella aerolata TaxID=2883479 RepID=A0A9X1I9E8_9PROT|nr:tripartite tricarboxylate transporter substrate binding protein [Roseicella aerolata]MCB4820126.1 tripartite tricarboxylate transporter substrate binding protein [Roseicella aerolata]
MKRRALIGGLLAAPAIPRPAPAQDGAWPARPIRLLVGWPPGGSVDILARILQPRLQAVLGQPVVVENRPGATGSVGAAEAARSPADGHTWLVVVDSHAIIPSIMRLPYDTRRDFVPVTLIGRGPLVVTSHPSTAWRSFPDLVAMAREQRPGAITYATAGIGTMMHVAMVQLCNHAGIQLTHVPYRGGAPALQDALAGQVPLFVTNAPVGGPHVRSGALKGLGVTTRAPWRDLPGVPSFHELGFDGYEAPTWWGVFAPAGVPAEITRRMETELAGILAEPEVRKRVEAQGMDVLAVSGDGFASFVESEMDRWARVVRENNIRVDG